MALEDVTGPERLAGNRGAGARVERGSAIHFNKSCMNSSSSGARLARARSSHGTPPTASFGRLAPRPELRAQSCGHHDREPLTWEAEPSTRTLHVRRLHAHNEELVAWPASPRAHSTHRRHVCVLEVWLRWPDNHQNSPANHSCARKSEESAQTIKSVELV